MNVVKYKTGFRVPPLSVEKIRAKAENLRPLLLPGEGPCHHEAFVGRLEEFGISYDVVEDNYLPKGVEASCLPEKRIIYITETTYKAITQNDERARFTIFHELGHLLLAHSRTFHRDNTATFPVYENSEWQADQFAAEILMPLSVIREKALTQAFELQQEFGVSFQAATYRLFKVGKQSKE